MGKYSVQTDKLAIASFINFYNRELGTNWSNPSYPEDDESVPSDQKIDAIYRMGGKELHIEHTSVDLVVCGKTGMREMHPAWHILNDELAKILCPKGRGSNVGFRFEYAKKSRLNQLKRIAPELKLRVEKWIESTPAEEWLKSPRRPDKVQVEDLEFLVGPFDYGTSKIWLTWLGQDANFVKPSDFELSEVELIHRKLGKIDRSLSVATTQSSGLLVIENDDPAHEGFHGLCGCVARMVAKKQTNCAQIWGYRPRTDPLLLWHSELDAGRTDCVFTDNGTMTAAQIDAQRMMRLKVSNNRS